MVKFDYNQKEDVLTCFFQGRLDSNVSASIDNEINGNLSALAKGEDNLITARLVFDLKEVNYISSTFIRTCVYVSKQSASGNFSIINCDPFVKKTFKIVGLDDVFNIQ
jgi:anti-anti-sigma factor